MPTRFELPASRLPDAQKLVDRFAAKARRLGMAPPSLTILRRYTLYWIERADGRVVAGPFEAVPHAYIEDRINVSTVDMVEVEVAGERPVIAGWRFVAVIESTDAGNILRKHPDHEEDLPEHFRASDPRCDHCGYDRRRMHTYIVQRVVDGVSSGLYMEVGRTCLQDFVGEADPSAWMATFEFEKAVREFAGFDDGLGGYGFSAPAVLTSVFLSAVAAEIRLHGYRSSKLGDQPTGQSIYFALSSRDAKERKAVLDQITGDDLNLGRRAVEWLNGDEAGSSDYIHNARTYCALGTVSGRAANTVASIVQAYRKYRGIKAERAAKVNEHLPGAEVKKRMRDLELIFVGDHSFDTGFGTKWIMRFEDEAGRCVIWRTGNPGEGYEVGDRVLVTGTVKTLGEWRGTKQTELQRCKVQRVWNPAEDEAA